MTDTTVSIRELKSRLSEYLRRARRGESVVITDRGVPVGRIVAVGTAGGDLARRMAALCEAGQAQWNGERLRRRKPAGNTARGRSVAQLLVDDRG